MTRALATVLALLSALALSACEMKPDPETTRPHVTRTAAPQVPSDLPTLPVGQGAVGPGDEVAVSGATIRVGKHSVDLAPLRVDSWAVVPGGLYFLNRSELWFTDLRRARPTPFKDVSDLRATDGGSRVVFIDNGHGAKGVDGEPMPLQLVYDAADGTPVRARYIGS